MDELVLRSVEGQQWSMPTQWRLASRSAFGSFSRAPSLSGFFFFITPTAVRKPV
jgi:hypothetical protein